MNRSIARFALLATWLVSTLACGPPTPEPIEEQPNFTAVPVAPEDSGLLRTIMIGLGDNMEILSDALWRDDLVTVATAARAVADHPHVSGSERQRIQAALADRFAEFVEGDRRVHDSAVRLAQHATDGDMSATLRELSELQSGCVACHDAFRGPLQTPAP